MRDTKSDVLHFWFKETLPQQWFQVSPLFDEQIKDRFFVVYKMVREGLCDLWKEDPEGCLALCLVCDQFPYHIFRDKREAFDLAPKALSVSKFAVSKGFDQALAPIKRRFLYLPYEHSELLSDQTEAVALFAAMKGDDPQGYEYARRHFDVIEKFGRFPHRNAILGRKTTPEEQAYLAENPQGF